MSTIAKCYANLTIGQKETGKKFKRLKVTLPLKIDDDSFVGMIQDEVFI